MKLKRFTILTVILLISSLLGGCGGKPPIPQDADSSIAVEVIQVTKTDMETNYSTSGKVEASTEATIAPKVSGRVAAVYVQLGDQVKKGQVLFRIESDEADNQLTQAEASLKISQASYDSASQALKDAQSNYDRCYSLFESGVVSKNDLEKATTQLVNAKLSLEQVRQQVDQSQATVNISKETVNNYSVTAPIDGLIGAIDVEVGELVGSQTNAAVIVDIDPIKIKSSVPETIVNTIKPGSKVPVSIDSLAKSVEGKVITVAPKADSTTMGYPAEIEVANPDGEIKPGMAVKINLFTGTLKNIVIVPVDAVIERDGQHIVYIVENDIAKEVFVEIGAANDTQIEITEGLTEGQNIVVIGNKLLSDEQQVKIVTEQDGGTK
ncbi:MAG: efflux RND transporter periplasmic adaptor subunit [Dehalobacterium sp.]